MSLEEARGPAPLTYQDTLRALGALADAWGPASLQLHVDARGACVRLPVAPYERCYAWPQLRKMAEARSRLRGRRPPAPRPPTARWEVVLRLAGRAMDAHPSEEFTVDAVLGDVGRPAACTVTGPAGLVLTAEECVHQQIAIARHYWRVGRRG
jgi:hypothetical protein